MELTPEQRQAIEQQKENCPFCMMVAGKIEAQKVYEDDRVLAVLDINPAQPGHVLLIPKEHYPILPLVPEEEFEHLFTVIGEVTEHLRKAMVAKHASVFIANGPAAGQQSQHFLVHVIPSDKPPSHFNLPERELDGQRVQEVAGMLSHNLPLMLKERAQAYPLDDSARTSQEGVDTERLAELIEENPEFKQLLMENPDAVLAGLDDNPSLKPLFEGVDVHVLAERLRNLEGSEPAAEPEVSPQGAAEETPPRAVDLSDNQLVHFIDSHERLRTYLLEDVEALAAALPEQPRLARFFEGTSPGEVRARYSRSANLLGGGGS